MTRSDGFAVMDVSVDILNDPKFRRIQRTDPTLVAPAFTAYLAVVAESWKAGRRVGVEDAWPTVLVYDPAVTAAMATVGLVDRRGFLPAKAWAGWFGVANERRQKVRARWRRGNAGRDADTTLEPRGSSADTANPVPYRTVTVPIRPEPPVDAEVGAANVIDYIERRTGRPWQYRPGSQVWETLMPDVRDFGSERVIAAMAEVDDKYPDAGQLVFGASRVLHPIRKGKSAPEERPKPREIPPPDRGPEYQAYLAKISTLGYVEEEETP